MERTVTEIMSKQFNPTTAQKDAIRAKADKILVSAAAGSGKSTVLAKRIISSITRETDPLELSSMMIVTFTRDSAEDLKSKITKEVQAAVSEASANGKLTVSLQRQLTQLPSARINTIHGICYSLVKAHFEKLGLPASVSIADDNIVTSIRLETMNTLIDNCYSGMLTNIKNFSSFAEQFVTERDDSLTMVFLDLYNRFKNDPNGFSRDSLSCYAKSSDDLIRSPYGRMILDYLIIICDYYILLFEEAIKYFNTEENYAPLADHFLEEIHHAKTLKNGFADGDPNTVRDLITNMPKVPRFSLSENKKTELGEIYREERKSFRTSIKKLYTNVFKFSDEEFSRIADETVSIADTLITFLTEFDERFKNAKLKRSLVDFNDLEHYALKLLYDGDEPSAFARELSSSLSEIYVDEYQDLNPVQNKIFKALSVSCPIFMVGDIKQSIYGFRGADPSAFSSYKKSFPEYDGTDTQKEATIFLSDNFRSFESVTSFSNVVSDAMFDCGGEGDAYSYRIPYNKADRLKCNSKVDYPPAVTFMNCVRDMDDTETRVQGTYYVEAEMVANSIAELINNGTEPKNIAILLRSTKTNGAIFANALKKRNINVCTKKGAKLFDTPEVQLALCLLNCCDNPYRDIFLAGALRSPVFGVTFDELINIKRFDNSTSSLYAALEAYTEKKNFDKGANFIKFLNEMREFACSETVDKLLWKIFNKTNFFTVIYDGGVMPEAEAATRRANLIMLHDIAKGYTESGQNGLFGFLEKIRIMIEQDKSPTSAANSENGVSIFSMHSSKGLERQHCFLCAMSSKIDKRDLNSKLMYDMDTGLAMTLKDNARITRYDTPFRLALTYKKELALIEEEMRILYVAMTRARENLYICSSVNDMDKLKASTALLSKIKHPYTFIRQNSLLSWIYTALNQPTDITVNITELSYDQKDILEAAKTSYVINDPMPDEKPMTIDEAELRKILSFSYPYLTSTYIPSKLSVSRLHPDVLDEEKYLGAIDAKTENGTFAIDEMAEDNENSASGDEKTKDKNKSKPTLAVPSFMLENSDKTATGAEKGTATHIFMQFCDYGALTENTLEDEISRLVDKHFMLKAQADLINRYTLKRFISSDIFKEIRASSSIEKEFRFNIKLPASEFTGKTIYKEALKDELIFVQGVIDCYFRDENGDITLVDYKTDLIPEDKRTDTASEDAYLKNKYETQLEYYKRALELLTGQRVKRTVIYSFSLGRCIEI